MSSSCAEDIYRAIPLLNPTSIRLVKVHPPSDEGTINCSLQHAELSKKPEYLAVSYTWGPPTYHAAQKGMTNERCCSIICNDRQLSITENLSHFLRKVEDESLYLWIDAICINQEDVLERNNQVLLMTDIYSNSITTLIWLGEEDEYTAPAARLMKIMGSMDLWDLQRRDPLNQLESGHQDLDDQAINESNWTAMRHFLQRSWFNRIWVLQEVVAAQQVTVMCGEYWFPWKDIVQVSDYYSSSLYCPQRSFGGEDLQLLLESSTSLRYTVGRVPVAIATLWLLVKENQEKDRVRILRGTFMIGRSLLCSDPRDKVYALLGICRRSGHAHNYPRRILPDYNKDVVDIYVETTQFLLAESASLFPLSLIEDRMFRNREDLPTWVPDYSVSLPLGTGTLVNNTYFVSKELEPEWQSSRGSRILSLKAAEIDVVTQVGEDTNALRDHWNSWVWLDILAGLDSHYVNGQTTIEAFWRTLIGDICDEGRVFLNPGLNGAARHHCPAPESLGECFRSWFTFQASWGLVFARAPDKSKDIEEGLLTKLDLLSKKDSGKLIRSVEQIRQLADIYEHTPRVIPDWVPRLTEKQQYYARAVREIDFARFFCTQQGLMGLGPMSLAAGDSIWLVPGADYLYVLRNKVSTGRFEFIGGAYVHGLMHGEAVDAALPRMRIIELE